MKIQYSSNKNQSLEGGKAVKRFIKEHLDELKDGTENLGVSKKFVTCDSQGDLKTLKRGRLDPKTGIDWVDNLLEGAYQFGCTLADKHRRTVAWAYAKEIKKKSGFFKGAAAFLETSTGYDMGILDRLAKAGVKAAKKKVGKEVVKAILPEIEGLKKKLTPFVEVLKKVDQEKLNGCAAQIAKAVKKEIEKKGEKPQSATKNVTNPFMGQPVKDSLGKHLDISTLPKFADSEASEITEALNKAVTVILSQLNSEGKDWELVKEDVEKIKALDKKLEAALKSPKDQSTQTENIETLFEQKAKAFNDLYHKGQTAIEIAEKHKNAER